MREYLLRHQAEAIEALITSASSPAEARTVRRLLDRLRRDGYSLEADARLANTAPGGATGLRLAASLGELPAALNTRLAPGNCGTTYIGLLGRTSVPLGTLARADYQRLIELEAEDPWHPLVLAWLAGVEGEPALQRALSGAQKGGDEAARVQIFAFQQLAWVRRQQGRGSDAEQAAYGAMRIAEERLHRAGDDLAQPAVEQALRDVAQTASTLALTLEDTGKKAAAFDALQEVATRQRQLIALRADDAPMKLALVDTLGRLAILRDAAGPSASGSSKAYQQQAWTLYQELLKSKPYEPMLRASNWPGMLLTAASMAGALTLIVGWVLLRLYRRRIAELMMASARPSTALPPLPGGVLPPVAMPLRPRSETIDPGALAAAVLRRAVLVQIAAGLAFGVSAAWLVLQADATEPTPIRLALMSWTWGWPTVLALGLVWDGNRRRSRLAWAVYFAVLFLLCTVGALGNTSTLSILGIAIPPFFKGLVFWAISLSFSPFLLLFLNRAVRSIGPVLLVMMLVAMLGGTAAVLAASTPVGMAVVVSVAGAMGLAGGAAIGLSWFGGMVAAAPLSWWLGRRLRAAYAAKWMSNQSLMIDALWGFQAVLLSLKLSMAGGPAAGWWGAAAFAIHKAITLAGIAPAARAARRRTPFQLLLLRVFTRRDRRGRLQSRRADAERLFDVLGSCWHTIGPIAMIGAPDLASSTIDPDEFLEFLAGRLRERFIVDPTDVPGRLASVDDRCDFDARWRVTDIFCGNDAWRPAVLGLMTRSDLVVMDLRDFGPDNQGCIFELQSLIDLVPATRVALLVDGSTRQEFLQATIAECISRIPLTSPNAHSGFKPVLIDVALGEEAAVDQMIRMAASHG